MFTIWRNINGQLASFSQSCAKFRLPNALFFHYLQIWDYIKDRFSHFESTLTTIPFNEHLLLVPHSNLNMWIALPLLSLQEISTERYHQCLWLTPLLLISTGYSGRGKTASTSSSKCGNCCSAEWWLLGFLYNFWTAVFEWILKTRHWAQPQPEFFECFAEIFALPFDLQIFSITKELLWRGNSPIPASFAQWLRQMLCVIQMGYVSTNLLHRTNHITPHTWGPRFVS